MPNEVIVFPDIEELLVDYLTAELAANGPPVPVHVQIPNPRPTSFVTVPRVGGPRRSLVVDSATISADSWAIRPKAAHDLAQLVRGLFHALVGQTLGDTYPVYRVDEFAGPGNLPDGLSAHARYTQIFSVWIRGRSI